MALESDDLECCRVQIGPCRRALPLILASFGRSATTGGQSEGPSCSLLVRAISRARSLLIAENLPRGCIHGLSGLDGDVPDWHVTLSTFLVHVIALKKCHVPLISHANVRPVTPAL